MMKQITVYYMTKLHLGAALLDGLLSHSQDLEKYKGVEKLAGNRKESWICSDTALKTVIRENFGGLPNYNLRPMFIGLLVILDGRYSGSRLVIFVI